MKSYFFHLINNFYIYPITICSIFTGAACYMDNYYSLLTSLGVLSSKIWQRNLPKTNNNNNNNENVILIISQLQTIHSVASSYLLDKVKITE